MTNNIVDSSVNSNTPFNNIPLELRQLPHWVCWSNHPDSYKAPCRAIDSSNTYFADPTNPATWSSFEAAVAISSKRPDQFGGIGFVFTKSQPYIGIDIDTYKQSEKPKLPGEIDLCEWIAQSFNTYTELSPSGQGIHVISRGSYPSDTGLRYGGIEMYESGRYFTFTGNVVNGLHTINDCSSQILELFNRLPKKEVGVETASRPQTHEDNEVIDKCSRAANSALFNALWSAEAHQRVTKAGDSQTPLELPICGLVRQYPSQSEADLALMSLLWFACHNEEQVVRLFQQSGLGQRKKARRRDYLTNTLNRAKLQLAPKYPMVNIILESAGAQHIPEDLPAKLIERLNVVRDFDEVKSIINEVAIHRFKQNQDVAAVEAELHSMYPDVEVCTMDIWNQYKRRLEQQKANVNVGKQVNYKPLTPIMTFNEMLHEFVYLSTGQFVACRSNGRIMSANDLACELSASTTEITTTDGKTKSVPTFRLWMSSSSRVTADTHTWAPACEAFCETPVRPDLGGSNAYNTWSGLPAYAQQDNYVELAEPFIAHMKYLCPNSIEYERHMEWLAHIVQKPEELPHTCYVHIASTHGIGRNWFASVLTRVLCGYVAANLDLEELLDGKFNGEMSKKLLAFSDEIHDAGGGARHKRSKKLRQMITAEYVHINPKYGRTYTEYNHCRFLGFSNYADAVAIDGNDRRVEFIENPTKRQSEAYYSHLYSVLKNQSFIDAVRQRLQTWDISKFNPGRYALNNDMKQRTLDAISSPIESALREFVKDWPGQWVLASTLQDIIKASLAESCDQEYDVKAVSLKKRHVGIVSCTGNYSVRDKAHNNATKVNIVDKRIASDEIRRYTAEDIARYDLMWKEWYLSDRKIIAQRASNPQGLQI